MTLWTVACQTPLSMGFSRQEYWSGLSCPPPGDLPDPGIKPASLRSPALTGRFFTTSTDWEPFLSPWDLLNPETEPGSPTLQADFFPSEPPGLGLGLGLASLVAQLVKNLPAVQETHV